ncbi:MAG: PepSY-associated TM helix domain-containing protein [Salinimicrobium sp.]
MNNRQILSFHSISGLIAGLFLILMGISGAVLVFQHDIEDIQWQQYIDVKDSNELNIDKGIQSIQKTYPYWDTRLIHFEKGEALIFNLRKPTARRFVFVDPVSGEIIKEIDELTTFTRWLLKFHYSLQAGPLGRIIVFIVGILFLISLLSGIYLYRRSILKTLFFRTSILRKNTRSFYSSLHRTIGVWALIFNLLLVGTGIFLAFAVVRSGLNPPAAPQTPLVTASAEEILQEIGKRHPNFSPTYIRLPLKNGAPLRVYGMYDDDLPVYSEFFNYFEADAASAEIVNNQKISEAGWVTKLDSMLIPLHFGQYGGGFTKILYCLVGLTGPFLSVSGFVIWQKKRGSKRKRS